MTSDTEFWLYQWKVTPCQQQRPHDWQSCPCGHDGETARRRPSSLYRPVPCPDMKAKRPCPRGESCPYTHSLFEYWLHPDKFRTCMCEYGASCNRRICFFAHHQSELRRPASSTCKEPAAATISARSSPATQQKAMLMASVGSPEQQQQLAPLAAQQGSVAIWRGFGPCRGSGFGEAVAGAMPLLRDHRSIKPASKLRAAPPQQQCQNSENSAFAVAYSQALDALMPPQQLAGAAAEASSVHMLNGMWDADSPTVGGVRSLQQQLQQQQQACGGCWSPASSPVLQLPQQQHNMLQDLRAGSSPLLDMHQHQQQQQQQQVPPAELWSSSSIGSHPSNSFADTGAFSSLSSGSGFLSPNSPILSPVTVLPSPAFDVLGSLHGSSVGAWSPVGAAPLPGRNQKDGMSQADAALQQAALLQQHLRKIYQERQDQQQQQQQQQQEQKLLQQQQQQLLQQQREGLQRLARAFPASTVNTGPASPQPLPKPYATSPVPGTALASQLSQPSIGQLSIDELAHQIHGMDGAKTATLLQELLVHKLLA